LALLSTAEYSVTVISTRNDEPARQYIFISLWSCINHKPEISSYYHDINWLCQQEYRQITGFSKLSEFLSFTNIFSISTQLINIKTTFFFETLFRFKIQASVTCSSSIIIKMIRKWKQKLKLNLVHRTNLLKTEPISFDC